MSLFFAPDQGIRPVDGRLRTVLGALVLLTALPLSAQPVRINELQSANRSTVADPDFGAFEDWVELHNPGPTPVDLGGYFLTDDVAIPDRWRVPDGTILAAGGYLVLWADGLDIDLHMSFGLSRDGEYVRFSDPTGLPVDAVSFGAMPADVSYGRLPSEPGVWGYFLAPTPGTTNSGTTVDGFLDPPVFDPPAGFHAGTLQVQVSSSDPDAVVRYTLDGTPPNEYSEAATSPIFVSGTTAIRAVSFRDGLVPSRPATATYFIDEYPTLPVVSLVTDPANFFDGDIGIYVVGWNGIVGYCSKAARNWNQDWERPIHIELFETDGGLAFGQDAGVKIFGGCTRLYNQKSLALYARAEYGPGRFRHRIFPWLDLDSFNNLVLRSSAQDWWRTMFRDGMIQTLIQQGMSIETQAYRPALVFLNGEYWGIHNLREKLNEHYFADHFGLDPGQIEIIQNDDGSIFGGSDHFEALMAYVRSAAISDPAALDVVAGWLDIDGYIDYVVAEIYSANGDWPGNNLKYWRPRTDDGRWRGAIFDMDMGFGGNQYGTTATNTLALATSTSGEIWSNQPWSTELLRRLLLNERFRNRFIQRMAAHISTTFETEHVLGVIDSLKANIAAEVPRHRARWTKSISYNADWDVLIEIMREFARNRAQYVRSHFNGKFGLSGSALLHLAVEPAGGGTIHAAGVDMPFSDPAPVFFRGVPLTLEAIPADGFRFVGWTGDLPGDIDTITAVLDDETWMTAVFEPISVGIASDQPDRGFDLLEQSYPNPARALARIEFETARPGRVSIDLFDALGRRVATLADETYTAGRHTVQVPVRSLPSGLYVYVMRSSGFRASRVMTVLR